VRGRERERERSGNDDLSFVCHFHRGQIHPSLKVEYINCKEPNCAFILAPELDELGRPKSIYLRNGTRDKLLSSCSLVIKLFAPLAMIRIGPQKQAPRYGPQDPPQIARAICGLNQDEVRKVDACKFEFNQGGRLNGDAVWGWVCRNVDVGVRFIRVKGGLEKRRKELFPRVFAVSTFIGKRFRKFRNLKKTVQVHVPPRRFQSPNEWASLERARIVFLQFFCGHFLNDSNGRVAANGCSVDPNTVNQLLRSDLHSVQLQASVCVDF